MDGLSETVPPEVGALKSRTGRVFLPLFLDSLLLHAVDSSGHC